MQASTGPGDGITLAELERDPHSAHAWLRARAPVCRVPAVGGWLVTSRDLVQQVLADPVHFTVDDPRFSTARVVGPSMLSLDGAEHDRHRAPFASGFRPARLDGGQAGQVQALAAGLVERFRSRGRAEVRAELAGPLATGVVTAVLGLRGVTAAQLQGWYSAIVGSVSAISAGAPPTVDGALAFALLRERVLATAAAGEPAGMLVAAAGPPFRLGQDELASNAAVVMFGGIETTEAMITNAVAHVLVDPAGVHRAREDPGLLANAVEESLRMEPAACRVDRYATKDVVLGGRRIPEGDLVIASIAAANRDPTTFADPDVFDITRANARQHLAFAHGPHFCVAAELARLQARTALDMLVRLPGVRLDRERTRPPRGLVFRKPAEVHLRWDADPPGVAPGVNGWSGTRRPRPAPGH